MNRGKTQVLFASLIAFFSLGAAADDYSARIEAALVGRELTANALWWGFDPEDATEAIQSAIDAQTPRVIVPYTGRPWIVRPIQLRSDLEVYFEPGVIVEAKAGEFKGRGDSLFSAADASNIILIGYGATLRMRKADYQSDAYEKAEWRMTLDFKGCQALRIEGLRLDSSGGDGIYLGATKERPYCRDVVIRNVHCVDHHRQGISVISAIDLLIENCLLSGTSGTAPEAGIDFEPNHPNEKLVNCVVRNCLIENNRGAGVLVYLKNLSDASAPVSIRVEDCLIRGSNDVGMAVGAVPDAGPEGLIEFVRCTVEGSSKSGAYIYDKSAKAVAVRFEHCAWNNVWTGEHPKHTGPRVPLLIHLRRPQITTRHGGIAFMDCQVFDTVDRPVLLVEEDNNEAGLLGLHGSIAVHNPHGARFEPGSNAADITLQVYTAP